MTLFVSVLAGVYANSYAQTTTTEGEAGVQNVFPSNVFGVALRRSLETSEKSRAAARHQRVGVLAAAKEGVKDQACSSFANKRSLYPSLRSFS